MSASLLSSAVCALLTISCSSIANADASGKPDSIAAGHVICQTDRAMFSLIQAEEMSGYRRAYPEKEDLPDGCYRNKSLTVVDVTEYTPGRPWLKMVVGGEVAFTRPENINAVSKSEAKQ